MWWGSKVKHQAGQIPLSDPLLSWPTDAPVALSAVVKSDDSLSLFFGLYVSGSRRPERNVHHKVWGHCRSETAGERKAA